MNLIFTHQTEVAGMTTIIFKNIWKMILNVFYDFPKILWLDALVSFNVFQLRSVIFSLSPFISQILRYLLIPIQILMTQVLNDLLSFQINAVTRPKGTYTELSNESNPLLVNHFSLIAILFWLITSLYWLQTKSCHSGYPTKQPVLSHC